MNIINKKILKRFSDFCKIILIVFCLYILFLLYKHNCEINNIKNMSKKTIENMGSISDTAVENKIKDLFQDNIRREIKKVYNMDVQAIKNLSDFSTRLQAGGLTIPGNIRITGSLTVSGPITVSGSISTSKPITCEKIYINGDKKWQLHSNDNNLSITCQNDNDSDYNSDLNFKFENDGNLRIHTLDILSNSLYLHDGSYNTKLSSDQGLLSLNSFTNTTNNGWMQLGVKGGDTSGCLIKTDGTNLNIAFDGKKSSSDNDKVFIFDINHPDGDDFIVRTTGSNWFKVLYSNFSVNDMKIRKYSGTTSADDALRNIVSRLENLEKA